MAGPKPDDVYTPNNSVAPTSGAPQDYLRTEGSPQDFGAQVGEATQNLGKTVEGVGQEAAQISLQYQQMQNETVANTAIQGYAKYASDSEMALRQKQGQNAVAALPAYQKDMQDQLTATANNIPSPAAKLAFMTDARNFYDRSLYSAGLYVGDEAKKSVIQSYEGKYKSIVDFTTLHYNDPKALASGVNDATNIALSIAHQQGINDPDAVHALVSQRVGTLVDSAITMQLSQGTTLQDQLHSVKAAQSMYQYYSKATIPGSPGVPMLDSQQADQLSQKLNGKEFQLQYRLDRQKETAAAQQAVAVHSNLSNALAMAERGVVPNNIPSDRAIMAAFPRNPERGMELVEQAHSIADMGHFTSVIPTATPEQVFQLREQTYPDANKPDYSGQVRRYNALNTVINQRNQGLTKDPAGYIMLQHPEIQAGFAAADKDPSLMGHYAEQTHTQQTTLGIPEYKQHLLPAGVAQGLSQKITSNPQFAQETIQGLQKKYGYLWPSVFHDISTIGGLPVQYQSVANLQAPDASILARVIQDKATGKAIEDTLPDVPSTTGSGTIKGKVYIDKTLSSPTSGLYTYMNSLTQSGSSPAQVAAFKDSVSSLAMGYAHYDNISIQQAVPKAIKAFLGNTQFLGGARVPSDKFQSVTQNAGAVLNKLDPSRIAWPKGVGENGQPSVKEYLDTVKAAPTWVTSPRDDSLWLMDIGGRFVKDTQGNPVSVPFNSPPLHDTPEASGSPFGTYY